MSVHRPGECGAAIAAFGQEGVARFAQLYPRVSGRFAHGLASHPLLGFDALADAAARMDPRHVEVRAAANRNGEEFAFADAVDDTPAGTIRAIERAGRWVMLRFVEQLPEYEVLLRDTIGAIEPAIRAATGAPVRLQGFIFVSSPGTLTPYHFDPEFNILMQVSGRKHFWVYPPEPPFLTPEKQERFHSDGDNLLAWDEAAARAGTENVLLPGEALYVPFKSPHWVRVGDDAPSVSLSLTWCSEASLEQNDAWRFNGWWRGRGHDPRPLAALPDRSRAKSLAWRILQRTGLAARAGR